jgi:hypothetical protein
MAKTNKKLSVKKETLRKLDSLTSEQLGQVAGGTEKVGYSVVVPPSRGPVTGGCQPSDGCLNIGNLQNVNVIKGY